MTSAGSAAPFSDARIKCVIWDLDETLWDGTLAEREQVSVRSGMVDAIRNLDAKGIVSSICSKNDFDTACAELERAGIWEYVVFPEISFVPKGQTVRGLIDALQLRPPNVLFVDDSPFNRNEVSYYCEGIFVADPNDARFLPEIERLVANTVGCSRLEQYRVLERKREARDAHADNAAFLDDSDIVICTLRNPADLIFKERIADLANRSNQLNFTNSRFSPDELDDYVGGSRSGSIHHGVVFVYDRFGDYGLAGFYAFDERAGHRRLEHFFFSCRVMNMGVEQAVYAHLRRAYGVRRFTPLEPLGPLPSVTLVEGLDERVRAYAANELVAPTEYGVTIIAGCTAGVLEHYLDETLKPTQFENFALADGAAFESASVLVYAVYQDYVNAQWEGAGGFAPSRFRTRLADFLTAQEGRQVFLLLASEKASRTSQGLHAVRGIARRVRARFRGAHHARIRLCNSIVRDVGGMFPNVTLIEMGDFVQARNEQRDPRHFERIVIRRVAERVSRLATTSRAVARTV